MVIEKFKEIVEKRHEYAKRWKEKTGGKVIGYLCTYVPEEILYAANILPVRIFGSHDPADQSVVEPHIYASMYCPYCRDCLAQGLLGRYDYLDGIVIAQSCLHIRQTFFSWRTHLNPSYSYYICMPHGIQSKHTYAYYTNELKRFKESVEKFIGRPITNEDLDRGIQILNTNRRLLRQLYELKKKERPPLTGLDTMYAVLASQVADKEEVNSELLKLLERLHDKEGERDPGVRLMMISSENDDLEFVKLAEGLGSTIVIDEQCVGTRYFWNEVIPRENRLEAIAARYIDRPPCPSKDWPERRRIKHIMNLAKEWRVHGAFLCQQKFCDPGKLDFPEIEETLRNNNIPTYFFELDITVPAGQFRTRIEAFIEMLTFERLLA